MRLIDADKLETSAVLGVKLQHADSNYYYFYEEETIANAPTVKAIPKGWISAYSRRAISNADYWAIIRMVTAWEKENEESN